ncbi:enoyl-CoA hydratase/isomerase family protein [Nocardia mangyaensis]|uniref:enoyl-CoA hydratase/isomerase family protein n=1 Tax=Nocardia mangyaensis TaxID=2213200 RepID=UPI002676224A|nr:enoyl-CoA hydratase/isomerase family protein [Nocardia mangyaensis]MDO3646903.1 enoyl-CoA hydratase/isomerase family protein [Nocardia mangyaensis]
MNDPLLDEGLALSASGSPTEPLIVLELDGLGDAGPETVLTTATRIRESMALVVGVLRRPSSSSIEPVLAATTLTLTDLPTSPLHPEVVVVENIDDALAMLRAAVARSPRAALVCGHLLRQTPGRDTAPALAAEAAAYSMLLAGPEFARWLVERGPAKPAPVTDRRLVRVRRSGDHLSIVLDHPQRRNALSMRLREELLAAAQVAVADPSIATVELSGNGPAFCSGGDLAEFGSATDVVAAYLVRLDRAPWRALDRLADRLVVRATGPCIGAGAEIAAFAGTVTATPDTYFCFPEVRMGLVPGAGGTVSVARRIGRWRAAWLMLTEQRLDAGAALDWGLIDQVIGAEI